MTKRFCLIVILVSAIVFLANMFIISKSVSFRLVYRNTILDFIDVNLDDISKGNKYAYIQKRIPNYR
jgi:hypothetical protein